MPRKLTTRSESKPDVPELAATVRAGGEAEKHAADELSRRTLWRAARIVAFKLSRPSDNPDAEEIASQVAEKMHRTVTGEATRADGRVYDFTSAGGYYAFLAQVCFQRVVDWVRKGNRRTSKTQPTDGVEPVSPESHPAIAAEESEGASGRKKAVRRAWVNLPEPDRTVVRLKSHEGFDWSEISGWMGREALGLPTGAGPAEVKNQVDNVMRRARTTLARALRPLVQEGER